jgi:hypothetical protein
MASPFLASSGPVSIYTNGPLRISSTPQGKRYVDNVSGQCFFVKHNGEITTVSDGLACDCGSEFTSYVRQHLAPFPYDHMMGAARDITNLWPERKMKLQLTQDGDWKIASVVSFYESISGPFSQATGWDVTVRSEERLKVDGSDNNEVTFKVKKITVNQGGTLRGYGDHVWQEKIPFVWLDPAQPALLAVEGACYHGSSEDNFTSRKYQEIITEYLADALHEYWDALAQRRQSGRQHPPEHVSQKVQDFVRDHPDLVNEEFCQHLYAWCLQDYLTDGGLSGTLVMSSLQGNNNGGARTTPCLLELANNIRYRYLPQEASDRDIHKISKYARDIHTERGIARILAKEIDCPCTESIRAKSNRMEKLGICFGCQTQHSKSELKVCSKCLFAKYCGRECQVNNW